MKYLTFSFLVLVLAFGIEVKAQGESSVKTDGNSCDKYKIGIMTPSQDIDFKMIIIAPPPNIDVAMVINPCQEQSQVAAAPQIIIPPKETDEFFKVPPFTIRNRYSR